MNENIVSLVIKNAEKYPEKAALIEGNKQISYSELVLDVKKIAKTLKQNNILKGDRVLIFVPMSIELYKIVLAVFYVGAIAVFVDSWADKVRIENATKTAACKGFIGISRSVLLLKLKEIRNIPVKLFVGINKLISESEELPEIENVDYNDTALITFTTGSTGIPKGANRTHGFLYEQHKVLAPHMKQSASDIELATLPIFALSNLATGCTTVIASFKNSKSSIPNIKKLAEDIEANKINSIAASPYFLDQLATYCVENNLLLKSLKKVFLGGAPVFPLLAKKLIDVFPETYIEVVYGSTEAEPISAISARDMLKLSDKINKKGLPAGKINENINLSILQITENNTNISSLEEFNSRLLPNGEIGEICVSGKHVLKDYYKNPEAQKENKIVVDGTVWHKTGDAGYVDSKTNQLFLLGKVKNIIQFADKSYYPYIIEAKLAEITNMKCGTLIDFDKTIYIVLELINKSREDCSKAVNSIKKLDIFYHKIVILNEIPKDPRHNTKIDYDKLKQALIAYNKT